MAQTRQAIVADGVRVWRTGSCGCKQRQGAQCGMVRCRNRRLGAEQKSKRLPRQVVEGIPWLHARWPRGTRSARVGLSRLQVLSRLRPLQIVVQEIERALAVDGVRAD